MGLSLYETDRLLGHIPVGAYGKQSKRTGVDLNSPETQAKIAAKMERCVFSSSLTLNPSYKPYSISSSNRFSLLEFSEYIINNDTNSPVTLELNIEAAEAGEDVKINIPEQAESTLTATSVLKAWDGVSRTVICNTAQFNQ